MVFIMRTINIHEVKTNLSKLVNENEPFVIAKSGKPLMQVIPYQQQIQTKKRIGFMKLNIPNDFDTFGEGEISALFNGVEE